MSPIHLVLMVAAILFLLLAALGVNTPRGNLMAAGLALWAIATLV